MPTYTVLLHREMRLTFLNVEAPSQEAAAQYVFDQPSNAAESFEDCEGRTLDALVDIPGDDDYEHSNWFFAEDGRLLDAARDMLAALEDLLACDELNIDPDWLRPSTDDAIAEARAAIAKAKGGAS